MSDNNKSSGEFLKYLGLAVLVAISFMAGMGYQSSLKGAAPAPDAGAQQVADDPADQKQLEAERKRKQDETIKRVEASRKREAELFKPTPSHIDADRRELFKNM